MAEPISNDAQVASAVPSALASATVSAVGSPMSLPPMDPEERAKSINVTLADLTAKGTALYQSKKYDEAAEVFSQATEMQAELNGEMAPENADILFLYGRSLFKVGQSKSDVLGGKAPEQKKKKAQSNGAEKSRPKKSQAESSTTHATKDKEEKNEADEIAEEGVTIIAKNAAGSGLKEAEEEADAKKPLFHFEGDETFEDSEEEEEGEGDAEEAEEEEEDDLAVAFEVLDLSRLLFNKRLEETNEKSTEVEKFEEGKVEQTSMITRHIKERLADTHDLLAEISLENERFPDAVKDCRASLELKQDLFPKDSEIVAEAHFKLSLALEFASVTTTSEDQAAAGADGDGQKAVDEAMRAEAATQLEKAIESTKLKLDNKEVDLAMLHAPEDNEVSRKQIVEVKEIIADMEQRLVELRKSPLDVKEALGEDNALVGMLGTALGETTAEKEARIEEAKKQANDITGLVRKKKVKDEDENGEAPQQQSTETNGKRKAEDGAEGEAKKAKVEEAAES